MLLALANLIRALAAYWELKAKRFEHDNREYTRQRIATLEESLEKLRDKGDPASTLAADRLREQIITERTYFQSLSDSRFTSRSGD